MDTNDDPEPDPLVTFDPKPVADPVTEEVQQEQPKARQEQPKGKRTKKPKPAKPVGAVRNWRDLRAMKEREFALPICPKRAVVMMAGAKSTGKTFTVNALCSMKAYGVPWSDGTKTKPGLAFVVTNEDVPEWDSKHSAWLMLHGKPVVEQDGVKLIEPNDPVFHREVLTKHGKVLVDRLDLLDLESVNILIAQVQATTKAEKLSGDILALDNLASLVSGRLDKPQTQLLVKHLKLIAEKLNCCVILINHVHLNNSRQYQGLAALGDLIDGLFFIERSGMRTHLVIDRLKGGVADGMTYEFIATVVTVGFRRNRKPITSLAMRLAGLVGKDIAAIDHDAGTRKLGAEKITPDHRVSSSQLLKMLAWDELSSKTGAGGAQHKALQRAFPTEWTSVAMDDGSAREVRRVVEKNPTRHWIECRILKPPPKPKGKPLKQPDSNVVDFPTPPKPVL